LSFQHYFRFPNIILNTKDKYTRFLKDFILLFVHRAINVVKKQYQCRKRSGDQPVSSQKSRSCKHQWWIFLSQTNRTHCQTSPKQRTRQTTVDLELSTSGDFWWNTGIKC